MACYLLFIANYVFTFHVSRFTHNTEVTPMTNTPNPAPVADDVLTSPATGLRLHYRDWGGTGRGLLLLHGLASSARIWDLLAPLLRPYGRVVALDQRGHAASDKPD